MYNNKFSDQLLPLLTPEMLTRYPDQTCDIINKLIRLAQKTSSAATTTSGGEGNLEDIVQTTTSYADGGVNIVTAYLSDGTTQDFQIRNGHKGSQGDPGTTGADATVAVGTTTTLPAGSNATVTNVGVPSAAVFNFGIPKGDTGAAGQDGTDGYSPTATVTKTGDTATITITDLNGTTTATVSDGTDANVVDAYSTSTTDAYSANYVNGVIPTVNDATLTIQKNGTDVATFTANSASNATANITVPVNTSDLNNDSGFLTSIPVASANDLGGIKVGTNLSIDANGVLSASGGALPNNIAYIGNVLASGGTSQIQTTDIADGAITTNKLDWGSIESVVTNSNGTAIKYSDGNLICYGHRLLSGISFDAIGSLYRHIAYNPFNFPVAFISEPVVTFSTHHTADYSFCWVYAAMANTTSITRMDLLRPLSATSVNTYISYQAIGRWK